MNKIAILAPEIHQPFIEGIQKNAWSIISSVASQGTKVFVFTQKTYGQEISHENVEIFYWLNSVNAKLVKYCRWFFDGYKISKALKNNNIENLFVFSMDWSFFWALVWIGIMKPKTKISLIVFSSRELVGINRVLLKIVKKHINHFFTRSQDLSEKLISLNIPGHRISKVVVLPQKEKFLPIVKRGTGKIKTVAYLSNHEKSAGIDTFIKTAAIVKDVKFILALRQFSKAEEVSALKFLSKLGVLDIKNIEVRRNITDMLSFYREIDAVVLPVNDENNTMSAPLVLLEAVSSGVLVFAKRLPVFKEYGDIVLFFNDHLELAEKLGHYYDYREISKIFDNSRILLKEVFDEKEALKVYLQKYE